jgi:hypothetical protein
MATMDAITFAHSTRLIASAGLREGSRCRLGRILDVLVKALGITVLLAGGCANVVAAADPFLGRWKNADNGGISRAQIRSTEGQFFIHIWGACQPECDWGESTMAGGGQIRQVTWNQGFCVIKQELIFGRPPSPGSNEPLTLRIVSHTHFTDNSGRSDYDETDVMVKQQDDTTHGPPPPPPITTSPFYRWVRAMNGAVPPSAFIGGHSSEGITYYICRAMYNGSSTFAGKLVAGKNCSFSAANQRETLATNYEVLTAQSDQYSLDWQQTGSKRPAAALVGGRWGDPLYLCQLPYDNALYPGWALPAKDGQYVCYIIRSDGTEVVLPGFSWLIPITGHRID